MDDWNIDKICGYFGCESVPWILARDGGELTAALRRLMHDPDERQAIGTASRAFMEQTWNASRCILPLVDWYQTLS